MYSFGLCEAVMTSEFPDRKAQFGCRTQRIEEVNRKSVRSENIGYMLGEHARIIAAVVVDDHLDLLARKVLFQVVRETLCCSTNRIDIHTVRSHAHNAAQTARTELKILVETLEQLFLIIVYQILNLLFCLFVIVPVKPLLCFRQNQLFQISFHLTISFLYTGRSLSSKILINKYRKFCPIFTISDLKKTAISL